VSEEGRKVLGEKAVFVDYEDAPKSAPRRYRQTLKKAVGWPLTQPPAHKIDL
jgi:hypothetical protein